MRTLKTKKADKSSDWDVIRCKVPAQEINVTNHALERYKERIQTKDLSDDAIREIIKNQVAGGVLVEHKDPADAVRALLSHNYEKATYYRKSGAVYVMSKDNTILTVHRGEAKKWRTVKKLI